MRQFIPGFIKPAGLSSYLLPLDVTDINFGYCSVFLIHHSVVDGNAISIPFSFVDFLETLKLHNVYMENQLVK